MKILSASELVSHPYPTNSLSRLGRIRRRPSRCPDTSVQPCVRPRLHPPIRRRAQRRLLPYLQDATLSTDNNHCHKAISYDDHLQSCGVRDIDILPGSLHLCPVASLGPDSCGSILDAIDGTNRSPLYHQGQPLGTRQLFKHLGMH
jgi:hypothetical protein